MPKSEAKGRIIGILNLLKISLEIGFFKSRMQNKPKRRPNIELKKRVCF